MHSRSFNQYVEQELGKFPHFVIYAILEWIIILLLFIDGFISFLSNEFAKFFELKPPCVICTRIDHILAQINSNSSSHYNHSICEDHKRDISSLAYCHVHRRLSNIRTMCEGCLLSFATERESDFEPSKSLVGFSQKDMDTLLDDDDDDQKEKINGVQRCSCCGEALKKRPSSGGVNKSLLSQAAPTPSPRASAFVWKNEEMRNLELTQIRLKFMPDNELDLLEDEDGPNLDNQLSNYDNKAGSVPLLLDCEDISEEAKTPTFPKGNKFFGIPLSDSTSASPRWASRIPKKLQLEKSELFLDSNAAIEADTSDSILNRLKTQVHLDRNSLIALYMELDEERSASAVAANNAMAMITRLQAEKAAVQMEALQYQRLMEEQSEYDQEALRMLKDLLMKSEEEMKVLEAELDAYRERYGHINRVGSEDCEADADEDYQELRSSNSGSSRGREHSAENGDNFEQSQAFHEERTLDDSPLDFEDERSRLFGMLKNLEKKFDWPSDDGTISSRSCDLVKHEEDNKVPGNKAILKREVSLINERLRAIEADSGFLKHVAMTLLRGNEGTKLLTEIALHLRKLRRSPDTISEDIDSKLS